MSKRGSIFSEIGSMDGDGAVREGSKNFTDTLSAFFGRLLGCYRLFLIIYIVFLALAAGSYWVVDPAYVAEATIGPPNPSPIYSMISAQGTAGGAASLARKFLGNGTASGSSNDPFQQYQLLLQSQQLMAELAQKDNLLPLVFYKRWDAKKGAWKPPGLSHRALAFVERALHRPVFDHPSAFELGEYMEHNLSVDTATSSKNGSMASLMTIGSGYLTVSMRAESPGKAEKILTTMLDRADAIIRQQQLADVEARIAYIENELPNIAQTEERSALVDILANQEEIKVMTIADKRFSYLLISKPSASPIPVSPMPPIEAFAMVTALALVLWAGFIVLEYRMPTLRWVMRPFKTVPNRRRQAYSH